MSRMTNRGAAPDTAGSVDDRLARVLDSPHLARLVPYLPAETLHQLIRHRGLDACGELVTSATPAQLTSLLDLDLWRQPRPGPFDGARGGRDEQFDVDRFGEWLEVLVNTGESIAARTVAALDRDVVIAGLTRYVRVFDPGIFEPVAQSDDEAIDRHDAMHEGDSIHAAAVPNADSTGDAIECEVGGYLVRARRTDAWDAIVALLLALDAEHGSYFHAVMRGCRRLSNSRPEIDGLDDLLLEPEQHLHDVAVQRERRRSQHGYATPADARAFLEMARQPRHIRSAAPESLKINPIVSAYFRAADERPESSNEAARSPSGLLASSTSESPSTAPHRSDERAQPTGDTASIDAVIDLLTEAGVMPQRPRALLEAADSDPHAARLAPLRRLMQYARATDENAYLTRGRELAFLANALLAGCSVQSRPFTPQEASDAAAAICNLGLEYGLPGSETVPSDSLLIDHDLVAAFEVGWSTLHQEVSLFAADRLISTLDDLRCVDRDIQRGLLLLRRRLATARDAGTPWLARGAAEVLAMLDATAWIAVLGVLDECPVVPAALTANLERRTTTVSATAFDFISTAAQIAEIHRFMRTLTDVLSR